MEVLQLVGGGGGGGSGGHVDVVVLEVGSTDADFGLDLGGGGGGGGQVVDDVTRDVGRTEADVVVQIVVVLVEVGQVVVVVRCDVGWIVPQVFALRSHVAEGYLAQSASQVQVQALISSIPIETATPTETATSTSPWTETNRVAKVIAKSDRRFCFILAVDVVEN